MNRLLALSSSLRSVSRALTTSQTESLDVTRARLLYQSKKRGILENDIILGDFAEANLVKMDREALNAYDKLINGSHMEWDLFYYLSGKKEAPADVANCQAFKQVKSYVDSRKTPR